ncbi:MAG: SUMF1/EgtB/PvdO family nonheme iron enzyme [Phycisphaerales bacterium]
MPPIRSSVVLVLACAVSSSLLAQGVANNRGLRFSEHQGLPFTRIGAVGNAPTQIRRIDFQFDVRQAGRVDHVYHIMTREVTNGEFLEFARAIAPYIGQVPVAAAFIAGDGLSTMRVGEDWVFFLSPGRSANEPIRTSFFAAAMYTNWLHNDKGTSIEAFQNGAYDTSTFERLPGQPIPQGQPSHNADARYWIPTMDEWLKAGYYDPNRLGDGEGGWWKQPNASDTQLIAGRPELGGQTNAGDATQWPSEQHRPFEVGMYPDVQSPWGLLDVSGGASEWTETILSPTTAARLAKGTESRASDSLFFDHVEWFGFGGSLSPFGGFRVASSIPAPSGGAALALSALLAARRRR